MIKIVFDGVFTTLFCVFIFAWILYHIVIGWEKFWYNMLKTKAWAKVYTDYPDMLLDRKYKVKYKKHWWNKYKIYQDLSRQKDDNYLYSEASAIVKKIEDGIISI